MRFAAAITWKLLLAAAVALAGPQSHLWWGAAYLGPGMNQWDAMLVVLFVSFLLAGLLLMTFVASGYFFRRRPMGWQVAVDVVMFGLAFGLAVGAGISARVVDNQAS